MQAGACLPLLLHAIDCVWRATNGGVLTQFLARSHAVVCLGSVWLSDGREGELDERMVELELPSSPSARMLGPWASGDGSMQEMVVRVDKILGGGRMGRGEKRKMKVCGQGGLLLVCVVGSLRACNIWLA